MDTVRWGIIGCGSVTEKKSGPALQNAIGSTLVAVMRRDAAKAEDFARRHHVPRWYDNAADLIADPDVDAVYVATPPSTHAEYAVQAARAGKPVYVEKPMATSSADCRIMTEACREAGVPLFVAYYRRALPRFLKIRDWLESGAIGEIRTAQIQHLARPTVADGEDLPWRLNPALAGGGLFVDLGSHTLDLLDFLLGPIVECRGLTANQSGAYPAEDAVAGSFRFASGAVGSGLWSFSSSIDREMNELIGTRGVIRFSTFGQEPVVLERNGVKEEFATGLPENIQQPLIQTMVDDLRFGSQTCPSTGETAIRTNAIIDILLSGYDQ